MMPMAHMRGHREDAMQTYYTVALSMLAGVGVGAIAVQGLHAQSRPPVYLITEIDVTDPEKYGKEFAPKAQATVRNCTRIEGDHMPARRA